jgi:hypothetical protein
MKQLHEIDFTAASLALAVANTPSFLIRKLKSDPGVKFIADSYSDEQILNELRATPNADPAEPLNAVRPYAYLTALWMKPRPDALRIAAELETSRWRWYSVIASFLLDTYSPISSQTVQAPHIAKWSATPSSTVPASNVILEPN